MSQCFGLSLLIILAAASGIFISTRYLHQSTPAESDNVAVIVDLSIHWEETEPVHAYISSYRRVRSLSSNSSSPEPSGEPENSTSPEPNGEPGNTTSPEPTGNSTSPEPNAEPGNSTSPEPNAEPENSTNPEPNAEPGNSTSPEPTGEPENSTLPEPTGEPEGSKPETEPEPETKAEPETEPEGEFLQSEPVPEWSAAKQDWKWGWELHIYGFGVLFLLLAIILLLIELPQAAENFKKKKTLKVMFTSMVMLLCCSRSFVLFYDAYNSQRKYDGVLNQFLWSLGEPAILSSFGVLLLVIMQVTKVNKQAKKYHLVPLVLCLVFLHMLAVLVTDFVLVLYAEVKILILLCHCYYWLSDIILIAGYVKLVLIMHKQFPAVNATRNALKTGRLKKLMMASVLISTLLLLTHVYSGVGVYGIYSEEVRVEPWPWLILKTFHRILEVSIGMVIIVMTITLNRKSPFKFYVDLFTRNRVGPQDFDITNATSSMNMSVTGVSNLSPKVKKVKVIPIIVEEV